MLQLLYPLLQTLPTTERNFYLLINWVLIFFLALKILLAVKYGIATIKRLHRIPCSNCIFFTGNYYLQCPGHPDKALTEEAINCADYYPSDSRDIY